ncbi:hypothetical protein FS749_006980 [Ceratobasidium sp. UAMH 11750]|nr:hypothetical protein FS749_006980 [Ceratobasidium sp. UAMH 11750]
MSRSSVTRSFSLFRACAFGPSTVSDAHPAPANPRGQSTLRKLLGLKAITPGAIAFSAILARWCLTPDDEFSETGGTTGIRYKEDYNEYKKLINEGLRAERASFERNAIQGPFMKLMNEWNEEFFPRRPNEGNRGEDEDEGHGSDSSDIGDAMAEIQRFGQQEE